MAALPKFEMTVFEVDADGAKTALGQVDFTGAVCRSPVMTARWLDGEVPKLMDLTSAMPAAIIDVGYAGRLAIPGFRSSLQAFVAEIGGPERLSELARARDAVSAAIRQRDEAAQEAHTLTAATWSTDLAAFGMVWSPDAPDEGFLSDVADAFDDWNWDDYKKDNPRLGVPFGSADDQAWSADYAAYVRANAPPFVFGTRTEIWSLMAEHIRHAVSDNPGITPDMYDFVEGDLWDHHEEAMDQVVGIDDLQAIVLAWFPHAGQGDAKDLALDGQVEAWMARQSIVSYWPDETIALPAFEGVSHQEAIAWCEARLAKLEQAVVAAMDSWAADRAEAMPAAGPGI